MNVGVNYKALLNKLYRLFSSVHKVTKYTWHLTHESRSSSNPAWAPLMASLSMSLWWAKASGSAAGLGGSALGAMKSERVAAWGRFGLEGF